MRRSPFGSLMQRGARPLVRHSSAQVRVNPYQPWDHVTEDCCPAPVPHRRPRPRTGPSVSVTLPVVDLGKRASHHRPSPHDTGQHCSADDIRRHQTRSDERQHPRSHRSARRHRAGISSSRCNQRRAQGAAESACIGSSAPPPAARGRPRRLRRLAPSTPGPVAAAGSGYPAPAVEERRRAAMQVTTPIRNREAPASEPHLP